MHHILVRHPQRQQNQRRSKAGAILAGGAVKHQRFIAGQQMREKLCEPLGVIGHEIAVGLLHQGHGVRRREGLPLRQQGFHALHDRGLDGQGVLTHAWQVIRSGHALLRASKIKCAPNAQPGEHRCILLREFGEVIRAKQAPPAHPAPLMPAVAAQVSEIGGARQRQRTRRRRHSGLIGRLAPHALRPRRRRQTPRYQPRGWPERCSGCPPRCFR